jgi:hypothetical protein
MTRMCSSYTFDVDAMPSPQLPQYSGGRVTASRVFRVPCQYAEEFALRQIGKYHGNGLFTLPQLPAKYPTDLYAETAPPYRQLNLVATSFSISQISTGNFNSHYMTPEQGDRLVSCIKDPESPLQMEKGYNFSFVYDDEQMDPPTIEESPSCECIAAVQINYEEPPWHCTGPTSETDEMSVSIMPETALSVDKSAGYEMYTLPNRTLQWKNITSGDRALKGDSYATIIIPKRDIVVDWHNVPVSKLCQIEKRLTDLRGTVNDQDLLILSECLSVSTEEETSAAVNDDCMFQRDTLLFIDWSEEKQFRTTAFRKMNTTTLRLQFKQKRVFTGGDPEYVGWNHLFCDRFTDSLNFPAWQEVEVKLGTGTQPLYVRKDFGTIFSDT